MQASILAFVENDHTSQPNPEIVLGGNIPRAIFKQLVIPPKSTQTVRIIMTVGSSVADASSLASATAGSTVAFDRSWDACHSKWEARWQAAFDPTGILNPGKAVPTLNRCAEFGKMHIHRGQIPHPELERF